MSSHGIDLGVGFRDNCAALDPAARAMIECAVLHVQEHGPRKLDHAMVAEVAEVEEADVWAAFPTLDAIMIAALQSMGAAHLKKVTELQGTDDRPGSWMRAYLKVGFPEENGRSPFTVLATSILLTKPYDPSLLQHMKGLERETLDHIEEDGLDPIDQAIIRAALEGLWLADVFEFTLVAPEHRLAFLARLDEMVDEAAAKVEARRARRLSAI